MFVSLLDRGFGTSGRDVLYKEAIELFKAHPLFGVGRGYLGPNYKLNSVGVYWFHSTVLQVAATMGIVGLAAYAYYYYVRFAILFKNFKYSFKTLSPINIQPCLYRVDRYAVIPAVNTKHVAIKLRFAQPVSQAVLYHSRIGTLLLVITVIS